jgi:hypothetical protein
MKPEQLDNLEAKLRQNLRAYQPKPEYVDNLKQRLTTLPGIEVEYPRSRPEVYIAAVAAVSGIALILLIARKLLQK